MGDSVQSLVDEFSPLLSNWEFWRTLTNPQLKELLRIYGYPVSGVKGDLIQRILTHLQNAPETIPAILGYLRTQNVITLRDSVYATLVNEPRQPVARPQSLLVKAFSDRSFWDIWFSRFDLTGMAQRLGLEPASTKKELIDQIFGYLTSKMVSVPRAEIEKANQMKNEKEVIHSVIGSVSTHFPIERHSHLRLVETSELTLRVPRIPTELQSSRGRSIPMPVPIPSGVSEQNAINYLFLTPDPVILRNAQTLVNDISNQSFSYGKEEPRNLLRYVGDFIPLSLKSVKDSIEELNQKFPQPGTALFEHLQHFFTLFDLPLSKVERYFASISPVQLSSQDLKVDAVSILSNEGFPHVKMSIKGTTLVTGPYGIKSNLYSLKEIDGLPLWDALSFFNSEKKILKKMDYAVIQNPHLELELLPTPNEHLLFSVLNPFTVLRTLSSSQSFEEMKSFLQNLTPPVISNGTRYALNRFLNQNPDLKARLHPERGFQAPLEYRLPTELWELVPEKIRKRLYPVPQEKNSFYRLTERLLTAWGLRWNVDMSDLIRDLGTPNASKHWEILNFTPREVFDLYKDGKINFNLALLYFGSRSTLTNFQISDEAHNSQTRREFLEAIYFATEVMDAGGLSQTEENANPLPLFLSQVPLPTSEDTLLLLAELLKIPHGVLLGQNGLTQIIERGFILPIPVEENIVSRFEMWERSTPAQQVMYSLIFRVEFLQGHVFARSPPSPLESYVQRFNGENAQELIDELGLVPFDNETNYYLGVSLPYVTLRTEKPALNRQTLHQFTDREILYEFLQVKPVYFNRHDLIHLAQDLLFDNVKHFFIPIVRRCSNPISLDFVEETSDPNVFIIGYGTAGSYVGYTLSNLIASFTEREGTAGFSLPLPMSEEEIQRVAVASGAELLNSERRNERIFLELGTQEAEELESLIANISANLSPTEVAEREELIHKIMIYIQSQSSINSDDRRNLTFFQRSIPSSAKELMKNFFLQIFQMGMYFRQWRGQGHPFPLRARDVPSSASFNQNQALVQHEVELSRVIDLFYPADPNLPSPDKPSHHPDNTRWYEWIRRLPAICWTGGSRHSYNISVGETLDGVRIHNHCIRAASSIWVSSGAHYLNLFFGQTPPGFNFLDLESIF